MDSKTITKMQRHYWEAKQTFLKKVKRKEDDFVVASDAGLDAKLEQLKSIDETNQNLLLQIDLYQDRVSCLATDECIVGRFLRDAGRVDETHAGDIMSSSGKVMLFSSHQYIQLRTVLIRIYRDVETFQYRAVADTFDTVEQMEKARTAYRAALLWMKDASKQLDPDQYNSMDKFKKVQEHVRKTKKTFDKLKFDSIQKIDLLCASRCNLFSTLFVAYQNTLLGIFRKTGKTMDIFLETFKHLQNNQAYTFTMLKELNDQSMTLRVDNFETRLKQILADEGVEEKDILVFFESEYKDDKQHKTADKKRAKESRSRNARTKKQDGSKKAKDEEDKKEPMNPLLDLAGSDEEDDVKPSEQLLEASKSFMPSSLLDLEHEHQRSMAKDLLDLEADFNSLLNLTSVNMPTTSGTAAATAAQNIATPSNHVNDNKKVSIVSMLMYAMLISML